MRKGQWRLIFWLVISFVMITVAGTVFASGTGEKPTTDTAKLPALPKEITMFVGTPLSATTPAWDTPGR